MNLTQHDGMKRWSVVVALCFISLGILPVGLCAQHDPGPRGGAVGAGGPFSALNANEQLLFNQAAAHFLKMDSVSGNMFGEPGSGLGPAFDGNSCAMCHAQPVIGGSSPGPTSPQNPLLNPQVALATLDNAANSVPSFITSAGPVREARFVRHTDGSLDGSVHGLYTIAGRADAPGCNLAQPDFARQVADNNLIFRIPTPTFGLGLVEATPDSALRKNLAANRDRKGQLGIAGTLNSSTNDGTVTRFGWKAQNKSLLIFSGEAYNVEIGVSNELFPNERKAVAGCEFNPTPEDATNLLTTNGNSTGTASEMSSDVVNFAAFMRLSAPPVPAHLSASAQNGSTIFDTIGCALCHTRSLTTGSSRFTGMSNFTYHPYSDFALHHMGSGLADGVIQEAAGPDEFRTAPLWGVGQRLFFLHDGRTADLLQAIAAHASTGGCRKNQIYDKPDHWRQNCSSEADHVIKDFNGLSASQVQDILNFLRSL